MVACFMATSDEALPMLLAYPSEYKSLGLLLILKLVIAILSGYLLDFVLYKKTLNEEDDFEIELSDPGCSCGSDVYKRQGCISGSPSLMKRCRQPVLHRQSDQLSKRFMRAMMM